MVSTQSSEVGSLEVTEVKFAATAVVNVTNLVVPPPNLQGSLRKQMPEF